MAFWTVDNTKVELQLAGVWTNITDKVRLAEGIRIDRGRSDEASQIDPASCSLVLDNRDGRFSWRKPTGPYYGLIGRNTPLRVSLLPPGASTRLIADATTTTVAATTPDAAAVSITGDIDLRFDGWAPGWAPNIRLVSKYPLDNVTPGQKSYKLSVGLTGNLALWWSTDGTAEFSAQSTVPVPVHRGRLAVRATLDVNNGAGGRTATFYTAPSLSGPWVQLGAPVVQAGVTSIFDSTSPLQVVMVPGWEVYQAEVRNGIGGTVVANPNFTTAAEGATSFADTPGRTWTVAANASITAWRRRFTGEVATWPTQWGVDERDIRSPITASGITRRLGQGASPLQSALRRGIGNTASLVAYWPLEDAEGSTTLASAQSGGTAMTIAAGAPELAADDTIAGSAPLPVINGAVLTASVPATAGGTVIARCAFYVPAAGSLDGVIMSVATSSGHLWELIYRAASGGKLSMRGIDTTTFAVIAAEQTTHTGVNGYRWQASMELTTSGANLAWRLSTVNIDTDSGLTTSNTVVGAAVGYATLVYLNPEQSHTAMVIGHPHILSAAPASFLFENYVRGQVPETPGRRVERLASEEGLTFVAHGMLGPLNPASVGALDDYQGMGPQPTETLMETLEDAAAVDLGALVEPRDMLAIGYRPRESLYNQAAALAVDYAVLSGLDPVDDDQNVRNDVTVTRVGGSSARKRLEVGPLSVLPPPNGVGPYDDQAELNLQLDAALAEQASWRVRMGTIDEARYPAITLTLAHPTFVASPAQTVAALEVDQGDLLTIANPPAWVPPGAIRQIAQGFTEVISDTGLTITVNCTPASTWDVGVFDETASRYSSSASTLAASYSAGATSWSVATTTGPLWTTDPAEFPFDLMVAGEQVRVTAISGATSPQTFTVTRAVNGVSKAQASGAAVELFEPARYAL